MKIIGISDTHCMHDRLDIPDGDMLIHAGDSLIKGSLRELTVFADWFRELPHKYKIIIAGNHDWCLQENVEEAEALLSDFIYLRDSSVTIEGIKIYGAPWQPAFFNWAFNLYTQKDLKDKWDMIPDDTDILITHGPPYSILDEVIEGENVGCKELYDAVKRVNPKVHIFGHIHEGYGIEKIGDTTFINASNCTRRYLPINQPIIFEVV